VVKEEGNWNIKLGGSIKKTEDGNENPVPKGEHTKRGDDRKRK